LSTLVAIIHCKALENVWNAKKYALTYLYTSTYGTYWHLVFHTKTAIINFWLVIGMVTTITVPINYSDDKETIFKCSLMWNKIAFMQ